MEKNRTRIVKIGAGILALAVAAIVGVLLYRNSPCYLYKRAIFENNHIFPQGLIQSRIEKLKSYNDKGLSEKLYGKHDEIKKLVDQFIHVG